MRAGLGRCQAATSISSRFSAASSADRVKKQICAHDFVTCASGSWVIQTVPIPARSALISDREIARSQTRHVFGARMSVGQNSRPTAATSVLSNEPISASEWQPS